MELDSSCLPLDSNLCHQDVSQSVPTASLWSGARVFVCSPSQEMSFLNCRFSFCREAKLAGWWCKVKMGSQSPSGSLVMIAKRFEDNREAPVQPKGCDQTTGTGGMDRDLYTASTWAQSFDSGVSGVNADSSSQASSDCSRKDYQESRFQDDLQAEEEELRLQEERCNRLRYEERKSECDLTTGFTTVEEVPRGRKRHRAASLRAYLGQDQSEQKSRARRRS